MKKNSKLKLLALLLCVAALIGALVVTAVATGEEEKEDATVAIEGAFSAKKIGETQKLTRDGYIGIPLEVTTYYDYATHGAAKPGYNGTIAVMYFVNTAVERIGTKTDVEIIGSMLERGYIVSVFDYKNNSKAVSPGLDWSAQTVRKEFLSGKFFTDTAKIPSGKYYDNFVVPAGYDISYANVFWEADKHAADGTLEKIVENWNTDFRNYNSIENKIIYWRNALGEQKSVEANAEWFSDAAGEVPVESTAANANYTKVKYTIAKDITDCVGPDGTPIDLNLYMHIVYPTTTEENPITPVPVAVLANSSEYLSTASTSSGLRPQHNGFLFNGYAGAVFDYLYQPMAQSDYWGYYDGQSALGGITGDRMNYGLHLYSDKKINTAAMRYLRYLTYTEGDTFVFDDESIGVFGNSKGGWFTFLGEAELKDATVEDASLYTKAELEELINARINAYTSKRQFQGHLSETRYDNGITEAYTKNGVTIDGGELQPWLTYTDENGNVKEILGYASWIYASNGAQYEDITEGHAPVFSALHLRDDFSTTHNLFAEVTKGLDVPSMYVIVDLGHTFAYGPDYYLGYDTYQAMFDFANYYLKHDAVKVIYTDPASNTGAMSTTAPITVKFSGAVPASEVEKITLTAGGVAVQGTWSSVRGGTEWTFEHEALLPGTTYTLTVPETLAGDNGKAMGNAYTATYYTESEGVYAVTKTNASDGAYFTVTVPENASASDAKIRFYVSNDAANAVELYEVANFDAANPGAATRGELVGTVALSGAGYYEIDVTEYVLDAAEGSELTFLLSTKKTAGVRNGGVSFASSLSGVTLGAYVRGSIAEAPGGESAAMIYVNENVRESGSQQYANELPFYANATTAITAKNLFGYTITGNDTGRKYRVSIRLYDTDTRVIQLSLNRVAGDMLHDKVNESYNFTTEAGKWQEFWFDYTVYETEYGIAGLTTKDLTVMLGSTGKNESPIYISGITVTETVTDVTLGDASLVLGERGDAYKKNGEGDAFTVGTTGYATLKAALAAASDGDTVKLNKNYTLTTSDDYAWGSFANVTLDLNGYSIYSESSLPVVHVAATSTAETNITVKNGSVYLSSAALIGYDESTSAGKGKVINVTLENLNVLNSANSMLKSLVSAAAIESASGADVNVVMNGVNVDFRYSDNSKNAVKVLPNGTSPLKVNYTIKGGSIFVDALGGVTVYDTFKSTSAEKDSLGNYVALKVPAGISVSNLGITSEGTLKTFKLGSTNEGIATYTVQTSEYATPYGFIPEEYADEDVYPFVMFDENGNFKGAYGKWLGNAGEGSVMAAARGYVNNAWNGTTYGANPKEAYIVLRRNYTYESAESYDNLAQTQGTVYIDLGGYTLSTGTYAKAIYPAYSKGYSGAAGQKVFPTTVYFSNGSLMHGKSGIVGMQTWDSVGDGSIVNKDYSFIFTNVTFGFVQDGDTAGLIAHAWDPKTKTYVAPFSFTYNDCVFDIRTTQSMYNPTIFNINGTDKYLKITHNVNGGTIIADNPAKITIISKTVDDYGSSVVFGKGSDGNYLSFRTLTSATAPTGTYKSDIGENLLFEAKSTDGNDTIYTLTGSSSATDYGIIGDTYLDVEAYPFVVFDKDGGFIKGYATLGAALSGAKTHLISNVWDPVNKTYGTNPKKATILLRRDYTTTSSDNSFNDMAQAQGEIVFDLGGCTITQGSTDKEGIFGEAKAKGWSGSGDEKVFPSTYTIINGNFKVLTKSLFVISIWETVGDGAVGEKTFTFNLKNVNIGYAPGASAINLLMTYGSASASSGCKLSKAAPFFFNYENCTFDLKTNAPSSTKLFNTYNEQWIKNTVTVKGGSIIAKSMTAEQLYTVESVYGSSVTFVKDINGKYTSLTLDSTQAAPIEQIPNDSGKVMRFAKETSKLYTLSTIITEYGVVPEIYGNTESYPLAVFQNGWFVGAYKVFADGSNSVGAFAKAKELTDGSVDGEKGTQVEILFRGDAAATGIFQNVGQILGTVIIDLNGKTFTQNYNSASLLATVAKSWKGTEDAVFKIFNGNIVLKTALLSFDGYGDGYRDAEGYKTFIIDFDNVNISYASGSTPTALLGVYGERITTGKKAAYDVSFNNCTFDLTGVSGMSSIFNANDTDITKINSIINVTVKGGSIIAANLPTNIYEANLANGSSVVFEKSGGSYTTLTVPSSTAPTEDHTAMTADGAECVFVKTGTSGTDVNYTLYPSVMVGYKIKTSVTLYSNFVYNIYIPKANVNSFTINGNTVAYTEVKIDGADYYHVKVDLAVGAALEDIEVSVKLNTGSTTVNASWTLNVLNYTKSVINGSYDDVTKNLMKDMLIYASAAYAYAGNTVAADKAEAIAELTKDYVGDVPTGEAKQPVDKSYFEEVAIKLDKVPSFIFTLADGYAADDFTFTVGGKSVTAVNGDGYVEIVIYAYMMLDDVTFTVKETGVTESYNLYAYYDYNKDSTDTNLTGLVKALMKYARSADEYRDYTLGNVCYHNYENGKCTKCGADDPDVGTMSLSAPASIYSNYAGKDISVVFSKSWYNGEVTYTTNNENVFVENGKIFAKGDFASEVSVRVTAKTKDHTATATVKVSTYDGEIGVEKKLKYYESNVIKPENKGGTIFVGDSYFDGAQATPPFWRDFYQDWAGEKAFLMGMSSSQIHQLEIASERLVYPMEPSEIVVHIGHNDMHHGSLTVDEFVARLTALLNEYHSKLPDAKIYYCSVDPKRDATPETHIRHESSFVKAPAVNAAMKALADANDWLVYVDTTTIFYGAGGTSVNVNMYPTSDGSHPTLVAYDLIRLKINEARGKADTDSVININNLDESYSIGQKGKTYAFDGDFAISGRLVITQFKKANAHLQLRFSADDRFLVWDANGDGKFGAGCEENSGHTSDTSGKVAVYDGNNGLILNWTVIVKDGDAYWFIGGKLQRTFVKPTIEGFSIDATQMNAVLYDIEVVERTTANETAYQNYIAPYFASDVANIEMYGQGGDITANGHVFTDASGNALTADYIIKGKLDIKDFGKSNPHIQFRFGSGSRFLLWDSNGDGKFGAGYTEGSTNVSDATDGVTVTLYNANGGLTLDWAVVVNNGKAYWFINGKLEKVFNSPNLQGFSLGALQTDAYFYDIELCVKSEAPEAYEEQLDEYFTYSFDIAKYGNNSSISTSGPTYTTDVYGNTLKDTNYVIRGTLKLEKINLSNPHLQFSFGGGYRFILWDSDSDGWFGAGCQISTEYTKDTAIGEDYDATSGTLTLDWAVIVKDGVAYWYINGVLMDKTIPEPSANAFSTINIGALQMDVSVYDVEIYAENGSNAEYTAVVSEYA